MLIVAPTLDQLKLVTPSLLHHYSIGVISADPKETLPSVVQQTITKSN